MAAKTLPLASLVDRAATGLGASIDAASRTGVLAWLERLQEWNARIDLTAARSPEELVDLMLADALVLSGQVPRQARIVDVGTGAGAPGLALALLRPDLVVTLVEPVGKRAAFLRTALGAAGRADVTIDRVRGEALASRRAWDVALSRATLGPQTWLDLAVTLAAPGGSVWVLLAKDDAPVNPRARAQEDLAYTWPLTGAARRAVRYLLTS
jgi:16S rRNA (guanine527-N7)-methyltransferase